MQLFTVRRVFLAGRAAVRGGLLAAALIAALWAPVSAASAPDQESPLIILKSIRVSGDAGAVVVEIDADGPMPTPSTGRLDAPPRFFLDFRGVITGTRGPGAGLAPLTRVRVALHSSNPPVTRIVLDLARQHEITIDDRAREAGRVRVFVGSPLDAAAAGSPADLPDKPDAPEPAEPASALATLQRPVDPPPTPELIPVPPLPLAGTPAAASPPPSSAAGNPALPAVAARPVVELPPVRTSESVRPEPVEEPPPPAVYGAGSGTPPARPSDRDLARYRGEVETPLTRFRRLRPLLSEIDRQDAKPIENLQAARTELGAVIRVLSGLRPPDALQGTHDMLLRAASLSMMAATLRADTGSRADPTVIRNAGSAAAGALLLLDRVCIEIGCGALPDPK